MLSSSLDNLKSSCDREIVVLEDILNIVSGEACYSLEHRLFLKNLFLATLCASKTYVHYCRYKSNVAKLITL